MSDIAITRDDAEHIYVLAANTEGRSWAEQAALLRFAAQLGSPYVDAAAKSWRYDEDVDLDSDARDAVNAY